MKHQLIWITIATSIAVTGCRDKDKPNPPREDRKASSSVTPVKKSRPAAPPLGGHGTPHEADTELLQTMK